MAALAALLTAGTNITKNFFEINTISIDNWTFKLFYKWSTTLFVFGSICVTHKQFFGDPILCDAGHASGGINSDVLDTYCWMYSTFEIPNEYKGQCNSGDTEDIAGLAIYNSYYQWVPLYLLVSAVFFYIPRVLWLHFEGGLMKYFGKGTRSRNIDNVEQTKDRLIKYFKKRVSKKYAVYLGGFIGCEILNLFVVIAHFYITDRFLNQRYLTFGWDMWQYYSLPIDEQKVQWVVNPMCRTFPRVASCNYFRFGPGGDQEKINAICILALNMINDKVFALIWWWCCSLSCLGVLRLIYSAILASSAYLRFQVFNLRVNRYVKRCAKKDLIQAYIRSIPRGDWFVLYQLSKNLYRPFFMDFLCTLSTMHDETKDNPELGGDDDTGDNLLSMVMRPAYTMQEKFGCSFLQIVSKDCQIGQKLIGRLCPSNIKRNSIDDTEIVENSETIKNDSTSEDNVFFPTANSQKRKVQCKECINQSQCTDCFVKQDKVTRHRVHFSDDIYDLI